MNNDAKVLLWGTVIGAVTWLEDREVGVFQYHPDFLASGIQLSPLHMPLSEFPFEFPALPRHTFKGLPGLLSDSLPDAFGNALLDAWLASQGRTPTSFHAVERLCYVGTRGMGALEFEPSTLGPPRSKELIEIARLVDLANKILHERTNLGGVFAGTDDREVIEEILRVGTSAGGARPKAILAWNPKTGEFRSGQIVAKSGFEHWLMKFDGVTTDPIAQHIATPQGYGKIEYVYHQMAVMAGIQMSKCRLHKEGGRSHFMTKRFDRVGTDQKIHMLSLGAIAHYDYRQPASYSYEQAIQIMKRLELPQEDLEQQVLRAFFNVVGRNQDDHVKNIAFLMDRRGHWRLSPAFDISYVWNPDGDWTKQHQMSVNGKRDDFDREDLITLAGVAGIKKARADDMLDKVIRAIGHWSELADQQGIEEKRARGIQSKQRLYL
jgi:serine/threonine-protein kinase HipA